PQADEIFGRDANDRVAHRVDLDHGTEHVLPRAKLRLSHRAAEYRDGRWIGGAVFGGREIAFQYRRRIEEAEESGAHHGDVRDACPLADTHGEPLKSIGGHRGRLGPTRQIRVARIDPAPFLFETS